MSTSQTSQALYLWLKEYMRTHSWSEEMVPQRIRAVFTAICLMNSYSANSDEAERMLLEIRDATVSWHVSVQKFNEYMTRLLPGWEELSSS